MGQEIDSARFTHRDFETFARRLREETQLLAKWFTEQRFEDTSPIGGFELEAWLVDRDCKPAPLNEVFLEKLANPLVVPELAKFNVELNTTPHRLAGSALSRMHRELQATLDACNRVAAELGAEVVTIGILPTVGASDLSLRNMSSLQRYRALNEQVLRLRGGRPLQLDIAGRERLRVEHGDVMIESAATSLQVHLQVRQSEAGRFYNASKVLAAPMVAACANAPYFYGKDLWDETRIPVFEQAVDVTGEEPAAGAPSRVTFGMDYVRESLLDCFRVNLDYYDILLPRLFDDPPERLSHLRLHNGTIWRWNRPLIGLSQQNGKAHLRIEHRVVSAPNSIPDTIANAALFFGLAQYYAHRQPPPESELSFEAARRNFYQAAQHGLDARILWLAGETVSVRELLIKELLPHAREGLDSLRLDASDVERYLGIISHRLRRDQNGTAWQRAYVARHGPDMTALLRAYLSNQRSGAPVSEWNL